MMKKIFTIVSVFALFLLTSCEKNVISYVATDLDVTTKAQVRLVYDLPLVTTATENITLLKYNDQITSQISTALGGIYPNSTAKYHAVPIGSLKVESFKGANKDVAVYSNTFNIAAGKWSAFIYKTTEAPLLVQDPEEYETGNPWIDTVTYIRFVNLFHKADGTPYGKIYLKGRRPATQPNVSTYDYIDIAACNYKEASAYVPYKLWRNGIAVWSGTESSMVFALFNEAGEQITSFASSTATVKTPLVFTGYSMTKGVNYIFHLNGKEGTNYAGQAIRLSTIAVN